MIFPEHWKVFLDGMGESDTGDVITTADGEIIGSWSLVDDVFYTFTPNGAQNHLYFEPFLGIMCMKIADWHESRERRFEAGR